MPGTEVTIMYKFVPGLLQYGRLDVAHSVLVFVTLTAYSL